MFLRGDLSVRKPFFFFDHFVRFLYFCPSEIGKTVKNVKIQEKEKRTLETGFLECSFFLILFLDPSRLDNRRIATTNNHSNQRQQHKQTQTQT